MKVHVFTFEFPRLQTGELTHREVETFMIETVDAPLLSFLFCPATRRWYQVQPSDDTVLKRMRARRYVRLQDHVVSKRIRTHCLLLEVA